MKRNASRTASQTVSVELTWLEWVDIVGRLAFDGRTVLEPSEVEEIWVLAGGYGGGVRCAPVGGGVTIKITRLHQVE